jgi:hypothetical protein
MSFQFSRDANLTNLNVNNLTVNNLNISSPLLLPQNPAFFVVPSAPINNITGNGAIYVLGSSGSLTKVFDRTNNVSNSGVFTAPIAGFYNFSALFTLGDITTIATEFSCFITTTTSAYADVVSYDLASASPGAFKAVSLNINTFLNLGDTVYSSVRVGGMAGNTVTLLANSSTTFFSGYLIG